MSRRECPRPACRSGSAAAAARHRWSRGCGSRGRTAPTASGRGSPCDALPRTSRAANRTRAPSRPSPRNPTRRRARVARVALAEATDGRARRPATARRTGPAPSPLATEDVATWTNPGPNRNPRTRAPKTRSRTRVSAPSPCRARAGSCNPPCHARGRPARGRSRGAAACRAAAPACR